MRLIYFKPITVLLLMFNLFGCDSVKGKEFATDMAFVDSLLKEMTVDEKIGQMTQVDRQFLNDISDISKYGFGSLLSGGGSTPKINEPKAWAEMYDLYQREALQSRLKIPLLYGIDAVHGHNNVVGATIFPITLALVLHGTQKLLKPLRKLQRLKLPQLA